jgi:hypothetical protein
MPLFNAGSKETTDSTCRSAVEALPDPKVGRLFVETSPVEPPQFARGQPIAERLSNPEVALLHLEPVAARAGAMDPDLTKALGVFRRVVEEARARKRAPKPVFPVLHATQRWVEATYSVEKGPSNQWSLDHHDVVIHQSGQDLRP